METVYIETTILSYLIARPSRDLILAAHQQVTRDWWAAERGRYERVTSGEVLREASQGEHGLAMPEICTPIELSGD